MLVVVGGHSRNIGKTSLTAAIIRRFRDLQWTAVKITQYGHGVCTHAGNACGCEAEPEHPFALSEEYEPGRSDTGRFLTAGARRSLWLRTPSGQIALASGALKRILERNANVIIESNSVLELVSPDLFLMLLDFACEDFKASSLRFMDRADAFVLVDRGINAPLWDSVARGLWDERPRFLVRPPRYLTAAVSGFVTSKLAGGSSSR